MTVLVKLSPIRTLRVVEPLYIRRSILDEAVELVDRAFSLPEFTDFGFTPDIDVEEKKDRLVVRGELPGVDKDGLNISIKGATLTIQAEKKEEEEKEERGYYSYHRSYGQYQRSIKLPSHVDGGKGTARLTNGKLEIKLPKAEKASRKRIEIKASTPRKRVTSTPRKKLAGATKSKSK